MEAGIVTGFDLREYVARSMEPRCAECFFFLAMNDAERESGNFAPGMGSCRAEPPGIGAKQEQHPITGALKQTLVPIYPVTMAGSRCRHWQADARTPGDHLAEQVERLVDTLRAAPPGDSDAT